MKLKHKLFVAVFLFGVVRMLAAQPVTLPSLSAAPQTKQVHTSIPRVCFPRIAVGGPFMGGTLTQGMVDNAATIIRVGRENGVPMQGQIIAISAGIVESRLKNVDYGDRDSVGVFQQRTSMDWGTIPQIMDVEFAAHSFYFGRGTNPGFMDQEWSDTDWGANAQAVQRSAFPDRYTDYMIEAQSVYWLLTNPEVLGC